MNNKKITYLLIIVVICVWGAIFYQMLKGMSGDSDSDIEAVKFEVGTEIDIKKDTIVLIANYRDPFLGSTGIRRVTTTKKTPEKKKVTRRRTSRIKKLKWPSIKYGGVIKSENKGNCVALITINNKNKLMYENDNFKEVTLVKIYKDSVHVAYKEEKKTIVKAK